MRTKLSQLLRRLANTLTADPVPELKRKLAETFTEKLEQQRMRQILSLQVAELKRQSPPSAPESAPDWTQEHQGSLQRFIESPCGAALVARMRATSFINFQKIDTSSAERASVGAAQAKGYDDAVNHLVSLSRVSLRDIEDKKPLAGEGEPDFSDHLTP